MMTLPRFLVGLLVGVPWIASHTHAQADTSAPLPGHGVFTSVESPDHRIRAVFPHEGGSSFDLLVDGKKIAFAELLTLLIPNEESLGSNGNPSNAVTTRVIDETWHPVTGKTSAAHNHANEITIHDQWNDNYALDLVVRAYDDGLAYRYVVSKKLGKELPDTLAATELGRISFLEDHPCWYADYGTGNSSQEQQFTAGKLSDLKSGTRAGMPVLVKVRPDLCIALTEADLKDWPGTRFSGFYDGPPSSPNTGYYPLMIEAVERSFGGPRLPPVGKRGPGFVNMHLPARSPWRVIMIGKSPGELIQSNLIENLNPPSEIKDTSWIKPGIASWDWWSGRSRMETAEIKKFIQLSADMGWPYTLIDAGWNYHNDQSDGDISRVVDSIDMPELLRFAKEKNVRLWLWMSWRDVLRNDAYKKAFPMFRDWGIAGVKIDYMDREDQYMVDFYHTMFQATADNHLMLDLHGAYKPTGARRTWPNFITQEGVLGNEQNRGSRTDTARHNVTIPYTRGLLGPMDYTPGGFVNQTPGQFKPTEHGTTVPNTRGQELAKFVVFESPLQMACDYPDNYRDQPGADFLKLVKTSWDEVKFLGGEVGESLVLARRSGDQWFVGGMTNEDARKVDVKLSFLPEGKHYKATFWRDAPDADQDATKLVREEKDVTTADTLPLSMAPAGGFVIHLAPVQ